MTFSPETMIFGYAFDDMGDLIAKAPAESEFSDQLRFGRTACLLGEDAREPEGQDLAVRFYESASGIRRAVDSLSGRPESPREEARTST
jgi:hypothetical protein